MPWGVHYERACNLSDDNAQQAFVTHDCISRARGTYALHQKTQFPTWSTGRLFQILHLRAVQGGATKNSTIIDDITYRDAIMSHPAIA